MSSNQELSVGVGSMRLPRAWNGSTGKKCSLNGCCLETDLGAIAEWSWWEFGLNHVSHVSFDEDSTALVQGGAVASPPSPTSSFSAHVRLWPPNRLVWPPPPLRGRPDCCVHFGGVPLPWFSSTGIWVLSYPPLSLGALTSIVSVPVGIVSFTRPVLGALVKVFLSPSLLPFSSRMFSELFFWS